MAGSAAWVTGSVTPLLMARTRALIVDYPGDAPSFMLRGASRPAS
jgi:hypothetical protein